MTKIDTEPPAIQAAIRRGEFMERPEARVHASSPCRAVWTRRHYWPVFWGAVFGAMYANGVLYAARSFDIELAAWVVPVTAQVALWLGVFCARVALFK